jgi:hypothetical protein
LRALPFLLLAACFGNETTVFPAGLSPLEANTAPAPSGETLALVSGDASQWSWVHGRGLVAAPAATVWSALKDPEVIADRRQTDRHMVTLNSEPGYEYAFELHYEVDKVIEIDWDEDWRFGTVTGSPAAPELAIVRYQKVWGSTFISLIEGSIEVLRRGDALTEVQFVKHVDAYMAGTDEMRSSITDEFNAVVARAHGLPLPPL